MRVVRRYRCDHGHTWDVRLESPRAEASGEVMCPEGHEAITCKEMPPADEVQIVIRPAARLVDGMTGAVERDKRYYISILDREDTVLRESLDNYTWDEAILIASQYRGEDAARALDWWDRKPR